MLGMLPKQRKGGVYVEKTPKGKMQWTSGHSAYVNKPHGDEALRADNFNLNTALETANIELSSLHQAVNYLQLQNQTLQQQVRALEHGRGDIGLLRSQIAAKDRELDEFEAENKELDDKRKRAEKKQKAAEKLIQGDKRLMREKEEMRRERDLAKTRAEEWRLAIKDRDEQILGLTAELRASGGVRRETRRELEDLRRQKEDYRRRLDAAKSIVDDRDSEVSRLTTVLRGNGMEIRDLKVERDVLREEITNLKDLLVRYGIRY